MKGLITVFLAIFLIGQAPAQYTENPDLLENNTNVYLGIGIGLPYGGMGGRVEVSPSEMFSGFLALGYNIKGVGVNGGVMYHLPSDSRLKFYGTAMFGYNAVIYVEGAPDFQKSYYGPTIGAGLKWFGRKTPAGYFDFNLLFPFRPSAYYDDFETANNVPGIHFNIKPPPIAFSIGYNWNISGLK